MADASVPIPSQPDVIKLRQIIAANPERGWDDAWKASVTPWDVGDTQPPLRDLINSGGLDLPRKGRALVPGGGRGYDALFIASSLGLDTLTIDISPAAVKAASEHFASAIDPGTGKVTVKEADFFKFEVSEDDLFDLVYDYTFFVAIPPSLRLKWGHQMNALVKPGGFLITLIFPLGLPLEGGPPFRVEPENYLVPLGSGWEKVLDKVPENSMESHIGKDRLVVWKKL